MRWMNRIRAARLRRTSPLRAALADLPAGLEQYWRTSAPAEHKGIPSMSFFFILAAEGLLRFFDLAASVSGPCTLALPSEAADSVWHAWLRWDPPSLDRFCQSHFGVTLAHADRSELAPGALLRTFVACCEREGIKPTFIRVPALFALDASLRMPGGHGYWKGDGDICYARLDEHGRAAWHDRPHPELSMPELVAAGVADPRYLAARADAHASHTVNPFGGTNDMTWLSGEGGGHHEHGHGGCGGGADTGGASDTSGGDGCSCGSSCGSGAGD